MCTMLRVHAGMSASLAEVGSLTPKCTASSAVRETLYWPWLLAPLLSLGFTSDWNHYLHQREPLTTALPIKGSPTKSFRDLSRWGEECIRLDVSIYLSISSCYLVYWTHCCIFTRYDKGIEISEVGCSYKFYENRCPGQRDIWLLPTEKNAAAWAWAFSNPREYTLKRALPQMQNKLQSQFTSSRHEGQSTSKHKSGENQASLALIFMSYFSPLVIRDWKRGRRAEALLSLFFSWITVGVRISVFSLACARTLYKWCCYSYRKNIYVPNLPLALILPPPFPPSFIFVNTLQHFFQLNLNLSLGDMR